MEATNWIFDHNQNSPNSNSSTQQPHHHHHHHHQTHHASIQTDASFLNFDSPDNHSDVSHVNLSNGFDHTNTPNHDQTGHTPSNLANSSTNTPSNTQHSNANDEFQRYLSSNSPIDIMDRTGNSQHKEDLTQWAAIPDLNDLDMQFFPDDDTHHHQISNEHGNHTHSSPVPPTPSSFETANYQSHAQLFSDLQSPAIDHHSQSIRPDVVFTPLVSPAVTPLDSLTNKHNNSNAPNASFFSPLTSPALEAKSPMKFRKSSSPEDSTGSTAKKYSKRKTPGNTPIVGPTIPGRIAKQSPVIKARKSSSYATNITHHHYNNGNDGEKKDDEIMAPPKQRRSKKVQTCVSTVNGQPATPATLMNFKLESSSAQSSPVILPSNGSRRSSSSTIRNYDEDGDPNDPNSKKTSHKLAEQGRRNRMNQAIQDLGALIPEELNSTVAIPSKATTVELASEYIKTLLREVDQLKCKLQRSDVVSNESISPLETTGSQ